MIASDTIYRCSGQWKVLLVMAMVLLVGLAMTSAEDCHSINNGSYRLQSRYFYYNSTEQRIILEDSGRVSHRIANRILKILLEKVAGYQMVDILYCPPYDTQNVSILLDRVSGRKSSKHCQPPRTNTGGIPETMVNLELWLYAGFNKAPWMKERESPSDKYLVDAGPLGPQGRMGWYIPTLMVSQLWDTSQRIIDHWRTLQVHKTTQKLSWWGRPELEDLMPGYKSEGYRNSRCRETSNGRRRKCATLFAAYKDVYSDILKSQIETLGLYVDIVWLKDRLSNFIHKQVITGQYVLFFSWHPNTLIASDKFTRINFPETHSNHRDAPEDCDFPVNQLTKVAWLPLKVGAPEAFHIISRMRFTDAEYDDILVKNGKEKRTPEQLACHWVLSNRDTWRRWLPHTLKEKTRIFLGGLFPLTGDSWSQPGLVEGARLAVEQVNMDASVLGNHTLELLVSDTQCQDDRAISQFISFVQDRDRSVAGIIGPGCSDPAERVASLSKHFHLLMISYGAEAETLSNQKKYPYFFRTVPPVQHYINVYPTLFKELGLDVVGALAEDGQKLTDFHLTLHDHLKNHGISLIVKRKYVNNSSSPSTGQILQELKSQNVRVIIADVLSHAAREIMCEAYKLKMTGHQGYVWFLPSWYLQEWWDVDYYNSYPSHLEQYSRMEHVPCSTAQLQSAIEGHFVLSKTFTAPPDTMVAGGITVNEYKELYASACGVANVEESNFASFAYDAVWVFAKGLHALLIKEHGALETLHTTQTAKAFRSSIANLDFMGVSGRINFDGSDRHADMVILQSFSNETLVIGHYISNDQSDSGVLKLDTSAIKWLSAHGPVIGRHKQVGGDDCGGLEGLRDTLSLPCAVVWLLFVVFVVMFIFILVIFIKNRCDAKIKKYRAAHDRIKELGLLDDENSHILVVDGWEIPRDNIVLNRALGEGAFCYVKGGEMYKEGEGWMSVAVKTLKSDFKTEEKLEFLREIGLMKQFKHHNIVQLRGVCTRTEPIYAVMEFMLHGNLKTYLLSRRSLVGQGVKEAEDVKAETLTQMAFDIAYGLGYLHANKFVHRDLACRNCLVHANKRVKIGDFGMTRHVSDTDHYRFTRKALLPIRWTAQESLRDGIYTTKSDIWSFGVLMYEIVTLGSFPYPGMSNREVLDHVIGGNPLVLPDKCPTALKSFISWCMRNDPYSRPELNDIVSTLEHTPNCLTPCLDAPTASVAYEDTDSLEMQDLPHTFHVPSNHSTISSLAFVTAARNRSHSWHDKPLVPKKKPFSVLGLSSFTKAGKKSSASRRSPSPSLFRSSSLCSGALLSNSACGLNTCSGGGGSESGPIISNYVEMTAADIHDDVSAMGQGLLSRSDDSEPFIVDPRRGSEEAMSMLGRSRNASSDRIDVSMEFAVNAIGSQPSLGGDPQTRSSTLGSDRGETSSGYLSQNSKGDSKHVCQQTVTSL